MASRKRPARRPVRPSQPSGAGPRRLGAQQQSAPRSSSAQRRYDRSHRHRGSNRLGWSGLGVVVLVVVALITYKVTSSGSPSSSGRSLSAAPASVVATLSSISTSTYNSVGKGGLPATFTVTKDQPSLTSAGRPRFLYVGAEYCPHCAMIRWSIVTALSRFGTWQGLKETSSSTDVAPIPTFSFVGATYTSQYVDFTGYEQYDRTGAALQAIPSSVAKLTVKYDGNGATAALPFNTTGGAGIPFLDIGNKYVAQGNPPAFNDVPESALAGWGSNYAGIADALADPTSSVGKAIGAAEFDGEANYMSAAICSLDGGKPASVCSTPGVQKALHALEKVKAVS